MNGPLCGKNIEFPSNFSLSRLDTDPPSGNRTRVPQQRTSEQICSFYTVKLEITIVTAILARLEIRNASVNKNGFVQLISRLKARDLEVRVRVLVQVKIFLLKFNNVNV